MRINQIHLKNFRCYEDVSIEFHPRQSEDYANFSWRTKGKRTKKHKKYLSFGIRFIYLHN